MKKITVEFQDNDQADSFKEEMKKRFNYPKTTSRHQVVHGTDENGKTVFVSKYDREVDMKGYDRNAQNLKNIFNSAYGFEPYGDYALDCILTSLNNYVGKRILVDNDLKVDSALNVVHAIADFREKFINYKDGNLDKNTLLNETKKLEKYLKTRLRPTPFYHACVDFINPIYEALGEQPVKAERDNKEMKTFTPEETDILYEGIINTGDDRFYDWMERIYDWWNETITTDLEPFMLQWIYDNPEIYKEYREWLDSMNKDNAIKSSVSIDDRLEKYISSDSFAERYGYDDYRIGKLVDMGFDYEDIEFKWDSPKIQRALKKIDKAYDEGVNEYGDLPQDYLEWAANLINTSTLEQREYKDWLRAVYGDKV